MPHEDEMAGCAGTEVIRINCFKSSFPIIVCIIDDDDAELLFCVVVATMDADE